MKKIISMISLVSILILMVACHTPMAEDSVSETLGDEEISLDNDLSELDDLTAELEEDLNFEELDNLNLE